MYLQNSFILHDDLDRQTNHTLNGNVHTTEYNDYGQTAKETVNWFSLL